MKFQLHPIFVIICIHMFTDNNPIYYHMEMFIHYKIHNLFFCQAQFQLASPVRVELRLALSLIITTPSPTPTRESRNAA